jgi:hypothetical protein
MPYELDAQEKRKCKHPAPNQDVEEGPLARVESEMPDARVACASFWAMRVFERAPHFSLV